jgi:hypothetical protein
MPAPEYASVTVDSSTLQFWRSRRHRKLAVARQLLRLQRRRDDGTRAGNCNRRRGPDKSQPTLPALPDARCVGVCHTDTNPTLVRPPLTCTNAESWGFKSVSEGGFCHLRHAQPYSI